MDNRGDEQGRDLSGLRVREPQEDQRRRQRRKRIARRLTSALAGTYLLVLAGAYLYAFHAVPRLPRPKRPPLQQPGGMLRQLTFYSPTRLAWSSDGKRLAFTIDDLENPWRVIAGVWSYVHFLPFTRGRPLPALVYLATVSADGTDAAVVRIPGGLTPGTALWRPGTRTLAIEAARLGFEGEDLQSEEGLWLFDPDRRELGPRLYAGECELISWSPDGQTLLYHAGGYTYYRRRYWVRDIETRKVTEVPSPPAPRWIDRAWWSPDSRFIAFRCHNEWWSGDRRRRDFRVDGLWVVDLHYHKGKLIVAGEVEGLVWMSDGGLIVRRSGRHDGKRAITRLGRVDLDSGRVQWLPWRLPYTCMGIREARGNIVVELASGVPRKDGQARYHLWRLGLSDGSLCRLADCSFVYSWRMSPRGDKIALAGLDVGPMPGLWVLDLEPRTTGARR